MDNLILFHVDQFPIRIPDQITLDDLKKYPTILIGYRGVYAVIPAKRKQSITQAVEDYEKLPNKKVRPPVLLFSWDDFTPVSADIIQWLKARELLDERWLGKEPHRPRSESR